MGVARAPAILWAGLTLVAALVGPPAPWSASVLACVLGLLALAVRAPSLSSGLLALGAAPLWTLGVLGPEPRLLVPGLTLGAGALLVLGRRAEPGSGLPGALPAVLLALGLTLAARQGAASGALAAAAGPAVGLALAGLALAGLCAGVRQDRSLCLALSLAGLIGLGRAGLVARAPLLDRDAVVDAAAHHVLRGHLEELRARPALGLAAIYADPHFHALAFALLPSQGTAALLDAGWRPETATLEPQLRLDLARAMEQRGEGGRAIRLLRAGRADPTVAWTLELEQRGLGRGGPWAGSPPPGTPSLPGTLHLNWSFFSNGLETLDWDASEDLDGLRVAVVGTPCERAPELTFRVDDGPETRAVIPEAPTWIPLSGPLPRGPHRLRARFEDDGGGPGCDRNVWVLDLDAP